MAAVLVGVGGIGGNIVSQVRTQMEIRVAGSENKVAAEESSDQFKYLLVDTRHEPYHGNFQPGEIFVIPDGLDRFEVNRRVKSFIGASDGHPDDPAPGSFADWWVKAPGRSDYYMPGDFASGAGQVRAKGKLSYHIELTSNGTRIVDAIHGQIKRLQSAENELLRHQDRKIYVYLVCSLGGGTGSGMVLTLAQHLRDVLPPQCSLIGVFLSSSIAVLAAGDNYRRSIEANTAAALAEIDFWQIPKDDQMLEAEGLTPFLDWRGAGNRIVGTTEPFELAYLYTFGNRQDRNLVDASRYYQYVAECMATELYSDLDSLVAGQHSNFIQMFDGIMIGDRTGRYASSGLASVRVPVDRITLHLTRRFGSRLLTSGILADSDSVKKAGSQKAEELLDDMHFSWKPGSPSLSPVLLAPGNGKVLAQAPAPPPEEFNNADRDDTFALLRRTTTRFGTWREEQLRPHLDRRHVELLEQAEEDTIDRLVSLLENPAGDGFSSAIATVGAARESVASSLENVTLEIEGNTDGGGQDEGLQKRLERTQERMALGATSADWEKSPVYRPLYNGFGKWFRNRKGTKAKTRFMNSEYRPYVDSVRRLAVAREAQQLLTNYSNFLERLEQHLKQLGQEMAETAAEFERQASADLGKSVAGRKVWEVSVLDDGELVDSFFSKDLEYLQNEHGKRIIDQIVKAKGGIAESLKQFRQQQPISRVRRTFEAYLRDTLLTESKLLLEPRVEELSVWDGLLAEMDLRERLNRVDKTLENARDSVRKRQHDLELSGLTMEPAEIQREQLARFAASKLDLAMESADPLWDMDRVKIGVNPMERANISVLAFDQEAFKSFCHREGIDESVKDGVEKELGIGSSHAVGKHGIAIYRREGRLPLSYLSPRELSQMKNSFDYVKMEKPLFTDQRYVELVNEKQSEYVELGIPEERREVVEILADRPVTTQ